MPLDINSLVILDIVIDVGCCAWQVLKMAFSKKE